MAGEGKRTWYCGRCLTTFHGDLEACPNLACHDARPLEGWGSLFEVGEVIDRHYRVIRRLATGGAGLTYLVREVGADGAEEGPELAVKVLWASRDHGAYLRRLSQEAQILQELAHPHIVVYRGFVHRTGFAPYLVTRFEHGGSLHDFVRQHGPLGLRDAASVVRQVLEALERAHQVGVIHRDLKPENVLLEALPGPGEAPVVRVADFGVAKVATSFGDTLTRAGAFVGTPQYAAPEQFDGLPPSPATDVFAAGTLLWFCLQGQPLLPMASRLDPEDARDLLVQRLPARLQRPDDPPEAVRAVEAVLAAAMAVEREARCSVRAMAAMLQAVEDAAPASVASGAGPASTTLPPEEPVPDGPADVPGGCFQGQPVPPIPDPTARLPIPASPPRRRGRRVLGALAVLVLLGAICAGGGLAAVARFRPDLLPDVRMPWRTARTARPADPARMGPQAADPAAAADWKAIQASIPATAAARACGLRGSVDVDLVVGADGRVQRATFAQGLAPSVSACLVSRLSASPLARTRAVPVAVRVRVGP